MPVQLFKLEPPELPADVPKHAALLFRTDRLFSAIQVIKAGGENNLHSHAHLDGMWTVLSGRARFYGVNDEVIADLGPGEGILIPRNFQYWFESAGGAEPLVILQVEASDIAMPTIKHVVADRIDHAPKKAWFDAAAVNLDDPTSPK